MAEYRGIHGTKIQNFSSDPANPVVGQVWYNSTSNALKYSSVSTASWASGGSLATIREDLGGAGTQTAALAFGGESPTTNNLTEEYDGSSWTGGGNLATERKALGGCGTQTAGLAFGGVDTNPPGPGWTAKDSTEEYDGSAWTGGGALGTARYFLGSAGTQTAALAFGGDLGASASPPVISGLTEEYDGSSWTAGGALGTARKAVAGCGATNTAALAIGGSPSGSNETNATEEYNGTAWTAGGNLATNIRYLAGAGTQTAAVSFGGMGSGIPTQTEEYDGSAWTTSAATLSTARLRLAGAGIQTAALAFGGNTGPGAVTEEYTGGGPTPVTITTS